MYNSITVNHNGTDIVLNKINQDKYTGEFYVRTDTYSARAFIRHTSRLDKTRGVKVERHAMELTVTRFPAVPTDPEVVEKSYTVFETDFGANPSNMAYTVLAQTGFLTYAHLGELLSWAS